MAGGFLAVGQAAALAVNATREMQRLTAQLEVATGSSAAAGAAFNDLTKFAAETPYTLAQVTEAYIKLKNLGIDPTEERLVRLVTPARRWVRI
jgi:phage tail tape-measure protein